MRNIPSNQQITDYVRSQIELYPEKFGIMGTYSRELIEASVSEDYAFGYDQLALRLTTSVLCGRTISEEPQVKLDYPASWWQHLKSAVFKWRSGVTGRAVTLGGFHRTVLFRPLNALLSRWQVKRPVKFSILTANISFEQRILYPEIDMPPQAGRAVVYETMSFVPHYPDGDAPQWDASLRTDPSRFMNRNEIARQAMQDLDPAMIGNPAYGVLKWLEQHGVNVDQLVKRR